MNVGVPIAEIIGAMKVAGLDDLVATGAFGDLPSVVTDGAAGLSHAAAKIVAEMGEQ